MSQDVRERASGRQHLQLLGLEQLRDVVDNGGQPVHPSLESQPRGGEGLPPGGRGAALQQVAAGGQGGGRGPEALQEALLHAVNVLPEQDSRLGRL